MGLELGLLLLPLHQVLFDLVHRVSEVERHPNALFEQMRRNHAVGEVARPAGIEQQTGLGRFPVENLPELGIRQQIFLFDLIRRHRREGLGGPCHKLPRRIPGRVYQHVVQLVGLEAHDFADRVNQQLFLESQQDFHPLFVVPRPEDQTEIDAVAEFLAGIRVADHLRLQAEHVEDDLNNDLSQCLAFLARQHIVPLAQRLAGNGLILRQGMPDQPACADSEEMFHRILRVLGLLQLLFQRHEGVFPKAFMYLPVLCKSLVADGSHITLFVLKVLHGVAPEKLYALLARPLMVLLFLLEPKQLVDNMKQSLVLRVDLFDANVIFIPPFKLHINLCIHIKSASFAA